MEKKKNGKKVKVEGGELPIRCPKCGSQMLECIQTKKYNKNRQTEATVYECIDDHRCGEVVIVTKKVVHIRRARRKTNVQFNDWPDVKPKDLRY